MKNFAHFSSIAKLNLSLRQANETFGLYTEPEIVGMKISIIESILTKFLMMSIMFKNLNIIPQLIMILYK